MYSPEKFTINDLALIHDSIESWSFATVVSGSSTGQIEVSHLPLVLHRNEGDYGTLYGHFARANKHWTVAQDQSEAVAIFHGPHAYISANWYESPNSSVPTWNYAVVHAKGSVELIDDPVEVRSHLQELSQKNEREVGSNWQMDQMDSELTESLLKAIVVFKIRIEEVQCKFKLGQNRSKGDFERVNKTLIERKTPNACPLANLMREHSAKEGK